MSRFVLAGAIACATAAFLSAQPPSPEITVSGCVQRAPSNLAKGKHYVLMEASTSPLGGDAGQPQTSAPTPAQPGTGASSVNRYDTPRETGGLSYLLEGNTDLDANAGQRVEVTGIVTGRVTSPLIKPSMANPMQRLEVKRVRPIAPHC